MTELQELRQESEGSNKEQQLLDLVKGIINSNDSSLINKRHVRKINLCEEAERDLKEFYECELTIPSWILGKGFQVHQLEINGSTNYYLLEVTGEGMQLFKGLYELYSYTSTLKPGYRKHSNLVLVNSIEYCLDDPIVQRLEQLKPEDMDSIVFFAYFLVYYN